MKKVVSVLLAVLMIMTSVICASSVFAEETTYAAEYTCTCAGHNGTVDCKCCVYCPTTAKRMACVQTHGGENGEAIYCCANCTGWLGCTCGDTPELCDCEICKVANQNGEEPYAGNTQIIDSDTQKTIITIFRDVLSKISEVFDSMFDAIFEFLRISDFIGGNLDET